MRVATTVTAIPPTIPSTTSKALHRFVPFGLARGASIGGGRCDAGATTDATGAMGAAAIGSVRGNGCGVDERHAFAGASCAAVLGSDPCA
jgi:hypothetical protein